MEADVARWKNNRILPASIDKATADIAVLREEISELRKLHHEKFWVLAIA